MNSGSSISTYVFVALADSCLVEVMSVFTQYRAGKDADGLSLEGELREYLRSTYLRPLRNAERVAARRRSRLFASSRCAARYGQAGEASWRRERPRPCMI